jgi:hypothetical protein
MILAIKCGVMLQLPIQGPSIIFLCVSYRYGLFDSLSELIHSLVGPKRTTGMWDDFL